MPYINAYVHFEDLDISDGDLVTELEHRGMKVIDQDRINTLNNIYELRRNGQSDECLLKEFLYDTIGRTW